MVIAPLPPPAFRKESFFFGQGIHNKKGAKDNEQPPDKSECSGERKRRLRPAGKGICSRQREDDEGQK